MNILFCGGGTGGHVYPALAIAKAVEKKHPDAEIAFAVRRGGEENRAITEKGYHTFELDVTGLKREITLSNVKSAWKLFASLRQAGEILDSFRPDIVIGTGGYVCFPVIFRAQNKGIKTVLHESNAVAGLSVKLLAKKADAVLLNFPGTERTLPGKCRSAVTGTPVREELYRLSKEEARDELRVKKSDFLIVSFGGSLGSEKINENVIPLMLEEKTKQGIRHLHSAGTRYYEDVKMKVPSLCQKNAKIKIVPYIRDMPKWIRAADLIIARSGASTVAEIATAGTPAILIPSPNVTGNHQYENAKRLADAKAAVLLEETVLTPKSLEEQIVKMRKDTLLTDGIKRNLKRFSMENADAAVLSKIEELQIL